MPICPPLTQALDTSVLQRVTSRGYPFFTSDDCTRAEIEFIDPVSHVIQTQEKDSVVKRWQHKMEVQPGPQGQAYYSDTVDIEASIFTLPVYALAQFLYRYRHRGWLKVAKRLPHGA